MLKKYIIHTVVVILSFMSQGYTQTEIDLADEYFSINDFKKAEDLYANYIYQEEKLIRVYSKYRRCLIETNQYDQLYKSLKKLNKKFPENYLIQVDLLSIEGQAGHLKEFKKDYKITYNTVKKNNYNFLLLYNKLSLRNYLTLSLQFIADERKTRNDDLFYSIEVMEIYKQRKENKKWIDEALAYLEFNYSKLEIIEDQLQLQLGDDDFIYLEEQLLQKIGTSKSIIYQSLLVWLYVQQKDFYSAFQQQRSIDKIRKEFGQELVNLAVIAIDNNSIDDAVDILSYVTNTYSEEPIYIDAQSKLIQIRQDKIIASYPVDKSQVNALIKDYNLLADKSKLVRQRIDIKLKQIKLIAFELHENKRAIDSLNGLVIKRGISSNQLAKVRLLLGDIYLFDNQQGEASLIFFKVENKWKSGTYAEQAKLKNAKIYYYMGEFSLSQSMLDILKKATSREISNDAIELSVFIKSNSGLDTTFVPLQLYADAELLAYQKRYEESLKKLDKLLLDFPFNTLVDEVYWKKSELYQLTGNQAEEKEQLKLIIQKFSKDIWADDAVYQLAQQLEAEGDKVAAMVYYKKILIDYKGSIYLENSRNAYRKLRGDKL